MKRKKLQLLSPEFEMETYSVKGHISSRFNRYKKLI